MSLVHHLLDVEAPSESVFEAISTSEGLASWWTTAVEGGPADLGSVFAFTFREPFAPRLKVTAIDPPRLLVWEGIGGHGPWGPTTIRFELAPAARGTTVRFWHEMERDHDADVLAGVNFNWAYYLNSLRLVNETGHGTPYRHGDPTARVGATSGGGLRVGYVISTIEGIVDEATVRRYAELAGPAIARFGGRFVVSNAEALTVEGHTSSRHLSMVQFPSIEAARAWYESPENAEARAISPKAFKGRTLTFVEGE